MLAYRPMDEATVSSLGHSLYAVRDVLACPRCKVGIGSLVAAAPNGQCSVCGAPYRSLPHGWELLPPRSSTSSSLWSVWDHLQGNGVAMYGADPERNLSVGPREDARLFAQFSELGGQVLDMGCGPQEWPSYFDPHAVDTLFVGIDPLVGQAPGRYARIRALAEYCPFVDNAFDRVLLATTLDHFVNPVAALREAARVLKPPGFISVWLGHKRTDAPPPPVSSPVYASLRVPDGGQDLFHIKRLTSLDALQLFAAAGLVVTTAEEVRVDEYRTNYFFRLAEQRL
jgi:SAM-dependent methyltransferase